MMKPYKGRCPCEPRLGHIGKEYAARLRLFRGDGNGKINCNTLLVMIAGSALIWAAFMAIHGL
jgi:hypothetical protein